MPLKKKRDPQDTTLRNNTARKREITMLQQKVRILQTRIARLEQRLDGLA